MTTKKSGSKKGKQPAKKASAKKPQKRKAESKKQAKPETEGTKPANKEKARAPKIGTPISLTAAAAAFAFALLPRYPGGMDILNKTIGLLKSGEPIPDTPEFKNEGLRALTATFGEAASIAAYAPMINKYLKKNDADDIVSLAYLITRLLRSGLAIRPSNNDEIWKDVWTRVNKKESVKKKRLVLARTGGLIEVWKKGVMDSSERKFLRTIKSFGRLQERKTHIEEALKALIL